MGLLLATGNDGGNVGDVVGRGGQHADRDTDTRRGADAEHGGAGGAAGQARTPTLPLFFVSNLFVSNLIK